MAKTDKKSSPGVLPVLSMGSRGLPPSLDVNGLLFIMPTWVNAQIYLNVVGALGALALWDTVELY